MQRKNHPWWVMVMTTMLVLTPLASAIAQTPKDEVIRLQAQEIFRDKETGLIHAIGDVEAAYGQRLLLAKRLIYDRATETVTAEDGVTLVESDGTVHFADRLEVTQDLKDGIVHGLRTLLPDDSRFVANGAVRKADVTTEMSKGVYTPCQPCQENPNNPPLWQIRARKIIHDHEARDIRYHDAVLEFFGVPVFYTPYITQPDSTVKRRSGFLTPRLENSTLLGLVVGTPYYHVVNNHFDFTFEPILVSGRDLVGSTTENVDLHVIGKGEARAEFSRGAMTISGSLTQSNLKSRSGNIKKRLRGNIASRGMFDINRDWRWGWDYNRASDQTYLRRYGFSSENLLDQQVFTEGFRGRNYMRIQSIGFQDLRPSARSGDIPRAIPTIDYRFVGHPSPKGDFFTFNLNNSNLFRSQQYNSHRLSLGGGWHLPITTRGGQVFSLDMTTRGDAYYITDLRTYENMTSKNIFRSRIFPQAALSWRYPFFRPLMNSHIVLEPVAAFLASLDNNNPSDIPNEDSLAVEFDDSDLFDPNRFSGYDRVETGQRFDYGILMGVFGPRGGSIQFFLGQSYRLQKQDALSALDNSIQQRSDMVGRFILQTQRYLNIRGRWRLNTETFKPRLAEVKFSLGPPIAQWTGNYLFSDNPALSRQLGDRNEIALRLDSQMTKNWKFFAGGTRDLNINDGMRRLNFGLEYQNDCFRVTTTATRNYTQDRDIEPNTSVVILLSFKNLGELAI